MSKVIDSLLVEIGADFNDQGFEEANTAFSGLTKSALVAGAGITGAFAGLYSLSSKTAEEWDSLGKQAKYIGTNAKYIKTLGVALEYSGGKAEEAGDLIDNIGTKIRDLDIDGAVAEEISKASRGQFDIEGLLNLESAEEGIRLIAEELKKLPFDDRRRVADALGLSQAQYELLSSGREELNKQLQTIRSQIYASDELVDKSAKFNDALTGMSLQVSNTRDIISDQLLPIFTDMASAATEWTKEFNELLTDEEKQREKLNEGLGPVVGGLREDVAKFFDSDKEDEKKKNAKTTEPETLSPRIGRDEYGHYGRRGIDYLNRNEDNRQTINNQSEDNRQTVNNNSEDNRKTFNNVTEDNRQTVNNRTDDNRKTINNVNDGGNSTVNNYAEDNRQTVNNRTENNSRTINNDNRQTVNINKSIGRQEARSDSDKRTFITNNVTMHISGGDPKRIERIVNDIITGKATQANQDLEVKSQ